MIADIKARAMFGAAVTGFAWLYVVGSPTASAQPPQLPAAFTCPAGGGTQFLADPEDANAFYRCDDGVPTNHEQCPADTKLMLSARPECLTPNGADDSR